MDNITEVFFAQEFGLYQIFLRGYDANDNIVLSSSSLSAVKYSCINNIKFHIDKAKLCYSIQALDVERC